MVLSPNKNQSLQPFLDVSLLESERLGKEWLENSGFTTDHFYPNSQHPAFTAASLLPTVLSECTLRTEADSHNRISVSGNRRWKSWRTFLDSLCDKTKSKDSTNESQQPTGFQSYYLPSDCALALEHFVNTGQIQKDHLVKTTDAIDLLLQCRVPQTKQDWKNWLTDLNGFFFRSCQTTLNLHQEKFSPIASSLAFGKGLLEYPTLISFLCSSGTLHQSDTIFPKQWCVEFEIDVTARSLFPENLNDKILGLVRSLMAECIEDIHDACIEKHPDFEQESFINIIQWSQHLLDQLQFFYQNPEVYFFSTQSAA